MGVSGKSLTDAAVNPLKHAQSEDSFLNAFGGGSGGKKGGAAPMPPDYIGAAREQGQQNIALARTNSQLGNPDISNPYGSRDVQFGAETLTPAQIAARGPKPTEEQEWERYNAAHMAKFGSPVPRGEEQQGHVREAMKQRLQEWSGVSPDAVKIVDTLNPQEQRIFDAQRGVRSQLSNTALAGAGRVAESFNKPFAFGGADDLQNKAEQAYLSRIEPSFQRNQDALRTRLATQGIDPYGEAANREHERLSFQENDGRTQAILNAFKMRPQMLQEELAIRNVPLNETMALINGSQVQLPQFQNYSGSQAQPAPTFEATQNQGLWDMGQFNVGQQRQASNQAGLFGLGAAALPYIMSAFSDRRLKSNVVRVGSHPLGIGVYEYDIFGKRERGVMADEVLTVKPEAVSEHESGYLMVDYWRLQCQ